METIRSKELGARLRELRDRALLKPESACVQLGWSRSKLDRTEAGTTIPKLADLDAALGLYGATTETAGALHDLRIEARSGRRGWWVGFGGVFNGSLPVWEDSARLVRCFETTYVPGLAQTAAYARAVIRVARPEDSPEAIDKRVGARMQRQAAVFERSNPPSVHLIVDEAILLRSVGGKAVLNDQISALWTLGQRPTVTVQIVPLDAGEHAGMDGGFEILSFDTAAYPEVAFTAGQAGDVYLEGATDLTRLDLSWGRLAAAALSPEDSARRCAELTRK